MFDVLDVLKKITYVSAHGVASKADLIYLEVSNSTGEGVSRLFEVALIEAADVQDERDNKAGREEAGEEEGEDGAGEKSSRFCSIL